MISKIKKPVSILLSLILVVSVFTIVPMTAYADTEKSGSFVKVTDEPEDWSGDYLIVYEHENGSKAFDGGSSLNSAGNCIDVTISNSEIASGNAANAAKVTIAQIDGGYSIKTAGGTYIGGKSNANQVVTSSDAILNTISLDDDDYVQIVSNTAYFRYNTSWGGFRYYKSVQQQPVCLYKYTESEEPEPTTEPEPEPTTEPEPEPTTEPEPEPTTEPEPEPTTEPEPEKNGIYEEDGKLYYYENDQKVKKGCVEIDGDYYYFGMNYYAPANGVHYLPAGMMNDLLPAGDYLIEDGKIIVREGLRVEDGKLYFYRDNKKQKGAVQIDDDIYYFSAKYYALEDGKYYISADLMNGLLPAGYYFIKDYKIVKDGFVTIDGKVYYCENYTRKKGAVKIGDDIYYFGAQTYTFLADGSYYISADLMNDTGLPAGTYEIIDGKLHEKNGIYVENGKTYFYRDNKKVKGAVQIEDDIYYFGAKYYALPDGKYYISADLLNGLLPAGSYNIMDGKIVFPNG